MTVSYIELYKIIFVIEILVAESLLTFRLKKRNNFFLKAIISIIILFVIAFLFPVAINTAWYSCIMFFFLFGCTIPVLYFCYNEPLINILFCALGAYTIQHFSYELANFVLSIFINGRSPILGMYGDEEFHLAFNLETLLFILVWILCYFVSYCCLFIVFGKKIKKGQEMKIRSTSMLSLIGAGLVIDIILNSVIVYYDFDYISNLVNYISNLLCCILLLYVQFGLLHAKELENEISVINRLWHQEKEQYKISKENIDIINRKCHDMRYQIREIGKNKNLSQDIVEEIENSIKLYDSQVKTGNEVLDIILTEKSLHCQKNKIIMTCVADGALLNFMDEADLYSLFGNAFDNAIEAVMKIDDEEKRVISFKIYSVGDLISINIKNSFNEKPIFDSDGLPITIKKDSAYHGYGVKSIQYIVDKYDGDLTMTTKDDFFILNILLSKQNKR